MKDFFLVIEGGEIKMKERNSNVSQSVSIFLYGKNLLPLLWVCENVKTIKTSKTNNDVAMLFLGVYKKIFELNKQTKKKINK